MGRRLAFVLVIAGCGAGDGSSGVDASETGDARLMGADGAAGGAADARVAAPGWRALSPLPAGPRQETAVVAVGNRLYVIGGLAGAVSDLVEVYDTAEEAWTTGPSLPMPVHHANAAVVGTRIVLAGGLSGSTFAP